MGLATSFYNDRDEDLGPTLVKTLLETKQVIPDFLHQYLPEGFTAEGSGDVAQLKFETDSDFGDGEAVAAAENGGDSGGGEEGAAAETGGDSGKAADGDAWGTVKGTAATTSGWGTEEAAPAASGWGTTDDAGGW